MEDNTRYAIPAEPYRWRGLAFAATLHAVLLGLMWLGARGGSDAQPPLKSEPRAQTGRITGRAPAPKEIAKPVAEQARVIKPAAAPQPQATNRLRLVEQKRKDDRARLEQQNKLAKQREREKKDAQAQATRKKQESQRREALAKKASEKKALAKKKAADAAKKLAADASMREQLRKEEMRRIAVDLKEKGASRPAPAKRPGGT